MNRVLDKVTDSGYKETSTIDGPFDPGLTQHDFDFVEKSKEEAFKWFEEYRRKRWTTNTT